MSTVRIGDAERDAAVAALADHYAAGRITKDEFDERAGQAAAARFEQDLDPLFADLPSTADGRGVSTRRRGPRTLSSAAGQAAADQRPRSRRRPVPSLMPIAALTIIGLAVITGTPWLLFGLFWLGAFAGSHRRGSRPYRSDAHATGFGASCGTAAR